MRAFLCFFLLVLFGGGVFAQKHNYSYTDNCKKAYQAFLALQNDAGYNAINKELAEHPKNLMPVYIADYEDCLTLLFNGGQDEYERRKPHLDKRLALINAGDKNSPWYKMCKAGIYMHWAFIGVRFDDKLKAANYFRKSFILLKENQTQFPDFEYDDIFFGMEEAAVDALPDNYKWIASIFGMKGNLKAGTKKIQGFLDRHQPGDLFYEEALIYNVYLNYFLLSDKEKAWSIVSSNEFGTKDNLLNSFVKANIALNYRKAADAARVLEAAQQNRYYYQYPTLDYEYGYSLLHHLDKRSIDAFKRFLKNYKGVLFVKDALQKLAYANYLFGMPETAMQYKQMIAEEGNTQTDADKHAQRFAERIEWPNKVLLKSQLLIDGGYNNTAYQLLKRYSPKDFTKESELLEYHYRVARVNDEMRMETTAITEYKQAIELGRDRHEQFGARAALQLGFLYERNREHKLAISMYREALSMKQHDFKNAIQQQAKAGVNRLTTQ